MQRQNDTHTSNALDALIVQIEEEQAARAEYQQMIALVARARYGRISSGEKASERLLERAQRCFPSAIDAVVQDKLN